MSLPTPVGSITPAARQAVLAALQQLLGDRLSTAVAVRERHGKDASYHPACRRTRSLSRTRLRR
jgi:hypothetical protein